MTFDQHRNFAYANVNVSPVPGTTGTSLQITSGAAGALMPTPPFNAVVWPNAVTPNATNAEVVRVLSFAGDVATIARAQEGSTARNILVGDSFVATHTAKAMQDIETAVGGLNCNVKSFGATGDGITVDTQAIASAYAAVVAAGGGIVFFPEGTYLTDPQTVASSAGVTFEGANRTSAVLKATTPTAATILNVTGSNVNVRELGFDGGYVSGSYTTQNFGLITFTGTSDCSVEHCWIKNSWDRGVLQVGACLRNQIVFTHIENTHCSIQSVPDVTGTQLAQNTVVERCELLNNWSTDGGTSGGVKMTGTGTYVAANFTIGHRIVNNLVVNTGQMGIEIWGGCSHSIVSKNIISSVQFGISFDGMVDGQATDNNITLVTFCGIEGATACADIVFSGNDINAFTAGGAHSTAHGIITSNNAGVNPDPTRINIVGGTICGCDHGIHIQQSNNVLIGGGAKVYGCNQLINITKTPYVKISGVLITGDGSTGGHIVIDCTDGNMSDIEISNCTLRGNATGNNLTIYDGSGAGHTITNLTLAYNNLTAATNTSGNSIWTNMSNDHLVRYSVHGNDWGTYGGACVWADGGTYVPPYSLGIQQFSIPVAAKVSWTVATNVGDQWFKVVSYDQGSPIVLGMHLFAPFQTNDGRAQDITCYAIASPYGQNSQFFKLPDAFYQGDVVKEIIYNNPSSGSVHEIWIHFGPTGGGPATFAIADAGTSIVTAPSAVTVEPVWAANYCKLDCSTSPPSLQASSLFTGAPSAAASAWKLGSVRTSSGLTLSTTKGVQVKIGSSLVTLATLTTNP